MSAAVALMLEGMPSPWDLHLHRAAGRVVVLAGSTVVAEYGETDLAMRNMAIVTLRRVGFPGWRVAEVFGLTPTYVARLKSAAARGGAAALAGAGPAGAGRGRWGRISKTWRGSGVSRGNRIWRSAGGWAWRGPRWPAAVRAAGRGGRCRAAAGGA